MSGRDTLVKGLTALDSTTVTARKRALEQLREAINDRKVTKYLDENSKSLEEDGINWDALFRNLHRFLAKDSDVVQRKLPDDPRVKTIINTKNLCCSLIATVVNRANQSMPFIKCSTLIGSYLEVMENQFLQENFASTYVEIIKNRLFPLRKYLSDMTSDQWLALFNSVCKLFDSPPPQTEISSLVEILNSTVLYGICQSSLGKHVNHLFPRITSAFKKTEFHSSRNYQERIIQLSITLCVQLAKEYRAVICHFGEEIICSLISAYDKLSFKAKKLFHDFLLIQLHIHHPGGAVQGEDSAYAFDWTQWNVCLASLYDLILTEIDRLCDIRTNRPSLERTLPSVFLQLAVEVCKQVFDNNINSLQVIQNVDTESCSASKRKKLDIGVLPLASPLKNAVDPHRLWPRLSLISTFVTYYPSSMKEDEFVPLLHTISDLQSSCKNELLMEYICICCSALLKAESCLKNIDKSATSPLWEKVWEATMRTAGLNQNEKESHSLIQALITYEKAKHISDLTSMFTTNTFRLSESSVQTLSVLITKHDLPNSVGFPVKSTRELLIEWLLPAIDDKLNASVSPCCLANVLVKLSRKNCSEDTENCSIINKNLDPLDIVLSVIDRDYKISSFDSGLASVQCVISKEPSCSFAVDTNTWKLIHHKLMQRSELLKTHLKSSPLSIVYVTDALYHMTVMVEVWARVSSYQKVSSELSDVIRGLMMGCCRYIVEILQDTAKSNVLSSFELMSKFSRIYSTKYPSKISIWLRESVPDFVLDSAILYIISSDSAVSCESDMMDMDDFEQAVSKIEECASSSLDQCIMLEASHLPQIGLGDLTDTQRLRMECSRFLSYFCSCGKDDSNKVINVADKLLEICLHSWDLQDPVNLNMTVFVIQSLIDSKLTQTHIESILYILKRLCANWCKDSEVVVIILHLLQGVVTHVHTNGDERDKRNYIVLINGFLRMNKCGIKASIKLIKCLTALAKVDPAVSWAIWDNNAQRTKGEPVVEQVVLFLGNEYYEVRLAAAESIMTVLGQAPKYVIKQWHINLFSKICKVLWVSFNVEGKLSTTVATDESANRTTSALHAFGAVLSASPVVQRKALFSLLELMKEKKLNEGLLHKTLSVVSCNLAMRNMEKFLVRNLAYLLQKWLYRGFKLEDLATLLFQLDQNTFCTKYQTIIVPCILYEGHTEVLEKMMEVTGQTQQQLYEDCFAHIMGKLLPGLISNDENALQCHRQLEDILSAQKVGVLLSKELPKVIVSLMKNVHDPSHFYELTSVKAVLSDMDAPCISYVECLKCFNYLQNASPSPDTSLLEFLAQNIPGHIEAILLYLSVDIHDAATYQEKIISFHHYAIFVNALGLEIGKENVASLAPHIICNVVHILTHLIKSCLPSEETLSAAACHFLKHFCEQCILLYDHIVAKCLIKIINALVPVVKSCNDASPAAHNVIKLLMQQDSVCMLRAVKSLNDFPSCPAFQELHDILTTTKIKQGQLSLAEEIRHFIDLNNSSGSQQAERLKSLHLLLCQKKGELKTLYDDLQHIRGFSEDCGKSVLHRLICKLVELASSMLPEVSDEATKCLGQLGPSDLGTLMLRPDSSLPVEKAGDVVKVLAGCLLDENIAVVEAASKAMHVVMKYKECLTASEHEDFMCGGILGSDYLIPYHSGKKGRNLAVKINENIFTTQVDQRDLWCPSKDINHDEWIIALSSALLGSFTNGSFLSSLVPVCAVKASFAENILPWAVSLLVASSEIYNTSIQQHIKFFFEQHIIKSDNVPVTGTTQDICRNRASVQCMLNVVHFLRVQEKLEGSLRTATNLDLNFLHVAQAAQFCNAYFSSILYVELWSDYWQRTKTGTEFPNGQSRTPLEHIYASNYTQGCIAQKILWEAYMKICDTDAVYGCGSSLLLDPNKRTLYYELQGQWDKVVLCHDMQLSCGVTGATRGLLHSLQKAGLDHVLDVYLRSEATNSSKEMDDIQYECAWRLSKWDIKTVNGYSHSKQFECFHFLSLQALHYRDEGSLLRAVNQARNCVAQSLIKTSLESSKSLYLPLSQLQQIQEVVDFSTVNDVSTLENVLKNWEIHDQINCNQFEYVEPILWQRIVMLKMHSDESRYHRAAEFAARLAGIARQEGHLQIATKCLGAFSSVQLSPSISCKLKVEEAQLVCDSGDAVLAKHILQSLLCQLSNTGLNSGDSVLYAQALKLHGDWLVETKCEGSQVVINEYFLKALDILEERGDRVSNNILDIYSSLARFSDRQYQNLSQYFKSRPYEIKKQWIEKTMQDVKSLRNQPHKTNDDRRAITMKEKQCNIDKEELNNTEQEKNRHLSDAVRYYLCSLEHGDKDNLDVFRVASLWLENTSHETVNEILEEKLIRIPSYKFVPILPQLAPRISNVDDIFTTKLNKLLDRCCTDHPHHTLPILLALANSYKDQDYCQNANTPNKKSQPQVPGAQKLVNQLKKHSSIGSLLNKMDNVARALISLAYFQVEKRNIKADDLKIPDSQPIRKLKNVDAVLVPTLSIPVNKNCNYENIVGVSRFDTTFSLVGGINAPKKISCLGTDGIKRPQLVKGKDDLRQDAVMQQVFNIMNTFLSKSKHSSKRKLMIRTYKVVPLSQRSGILEWCLNTEPLLHYLCGVDHKAGAHKRYQPDDVPTLKCREMVTSAADKSNAQKLESFKNICKSLHPVFRYFFLEHFPTPGVWFERRLAYIHSVATSSMIGYILGLGDRHLFNILVDKGTAEVIHIDFGVAFEMGHILPTPETVPFRLTRDIVDGMGVSGIEGVFRRSCEKTMTVLREHQAILLTVLEVLLYDPLYHWTITPSKAYKIQGKDVKLGNDDEDSVEVNGMAERALQRLKEKLQGTEGDVSASVPAQVNRLLQEATSLENLSRLWVGWESYL